MKKKEMWVRDWKKLWDELVQVVVYSLLTKLIVIKSQTILTAKRVRYQKQP